MPILNGFQCMILQVRRRKKQKRKNKFNNIIFKIKIGICLRIILLKIQVKIHRNS
jgi:hypothetical protein